MSNTPEQTIDATENMTAIKHTAESYQQPEAFALITLGENNEPDHTTYRVFEAMPEAVEADTLSFLKRLAGNYGHLTLGTLAFTADALGIEVTGSHLLVRAKDPKAVVWPGLSVDFANLIATMARDTDYHLHAVDIDEASEPISPALEPAIEALYRADEPQPDYGWLPLVFCTSKQGFGKYVNDTQDQLTGSLAEELASMLEQALSGIEGLRAHVFTASSADEAMQKLSLLKDTEGKSDA